jgi:anti-sigma factor RsiW
MLHGFIDGELDAVHSLRFEQHLATCTRCAREVAKFQTLRKVVAQNGVRWPIPPHVEATVLAAISREVHVSTKSNPAKSRQTDTQPSKIAEWIKGQWSKQWLMVPSLAALAASLFIVIAPLRMQTSIQDEVVASHVRSLLVDHLTDVATSDQHTVKPWFNGKIDFSPPVVDLAPQGFPLVGGRVDYIGGRVVAALVYRRGGHLINVFIWPGPPVPTTTAAHDGYHMTNWSEGELNFWAVSDVNPDDVGKLRDTFIAKTAS